MDKHVPEVVSGPKRLKYRITMENLSDPSEKEVIECEGALIFHGKLNTKTVQVQSNIGYCGEILVIEAITKAIPTHLKEFYNNMQLFFNSQANKKTNG